MSSRKPTTPPAERDALILDAAAELFDARGVHEVGMDELIRRTGLGKATVYRRFPSKDALVAAYLDRLAARILELVDADLRRHADDPAGAVDAIFAAVAEDVARPGFRGCAFNNASVEYPAGHPARVAAARYRDELRRRLRGVAGDRVGDELALLVDGMYTSAAHLGASGPASAGPALARALLRRRPG